MDFKLELVAVPVSDVDRAKAFYVDQAGFNADHDHRVSEDMRFVQLTPPGSACSIALGVGITDAEPGSVKGLQLVVTDIEAARAELAGRGVEVSDIQRFPWGAFVFFSDPDGNAWAVQDLTGTRPESMASYSLNPRAVARAEELIDARQYVLQSEWGSVQPKAAEENAYLEKHSFEEY